MAATYVISVVAPTPARWPSAWALARVVPWHVAERYRAVRWHFTTGLRMQVRSVLRN